MLAVFLTKDTHSGCTADAVSLASQAPKIFFILLVGHFLRLLKSHLGNKKGVFLLPDMKISKFGKQKWGVFVPRMSSFLRWALQATLY
jgi:hypothetical protein